MNTTIHEHRTRINSQDTWTTQDGFVVQWPTSYEHFVLGQWASVVEHVCESTPNLIYESPSSQKRPRSSVPTISIFPDAKVPNPPSPHDFTLSNLPLRDKLQPFDSGNLVFKSKGGCIRIYITSNTSVVGMVRMTADSGSVPSSIFLSVFDAMVKDFPPLAQPVIYPGAWAGKQAKCEAQISEVHTKCDGYESDLKKSSQEIQGLITALDATKTKYEQEIRERSIYTFWNDRIQALSGTELPSDKIARSADPSDGGDSTESSPKIESIPSLRRTRKWLLIGLIVIPILYLIGTVAILVFSDVGLLPYITVPVVLLTAPIAWMVGMINRSIHHAQLLLDDACVRVGVIHLYTDKLRAGLESDMWKLTYQTMLQTVARPAPSSPAPPSDPSPPVIQALKGLES